ncbi:hypothetical protein [Streptobacillus canis]|uniref:hypothetical protein n=1 Tax=Streptobacillus canis TaxID=2678686 RepID=UPI0012E1B6E4|nr:hypothetical protein [Streptobacillus canis]
MANEILYKEELQPTLNTIIGVTPKTLPAVLNKGDIVKYGNYLYKYKGVNGVRKELVDESNFKKVGLRYRENGYKVDIVDSMENLYKWMFFEGLNGDRQKSKWTLRKQELRKQYNLKTIVFFNEEVDVSYIWSTFERVAIKNNYDPKFFFKFPIKDYYDKTYNSYEEIKKSNPYFSRKISYGNNLNYTYLKKQDILNERKIIYTNFEKFLENNNPVHKYTSQELKTYLCFGGFLKKIKQYGLKDFYRNEFEFGVFQNFFEYTEKLEEKENIFNFHIYDIQHENSYATYGFNFSYSPTQITTNRFWLPYFNDMEGSDYSGKSARTLNHEFNKYGIYFKLEEDGNYVYRFKSVFTDRNQHEEWGTKGPWGARYAYYLSATDVRGDGDTYCRWQPKEIDTELNFTIENGNIINVSLNFSEETRDTNRFKDEFMNTGYTFENGYLYIKVFYAIWSYDDAGDWNECQFAHIIPPFSLEFKGDNEFGSKPINNGNNHFKPPVDEWED